MSALICTANSSSVGTGSATTKTILQITAPASTGIRVTRASISFDGTSPTAGKALVELVKGATSGTGTNLTPLKVHGHTGSVQSTAKENFSGEPSGGSVAFSELVHTQSGYTAPEEIVLNPGETLAFRTNVPAAVNARARFRWEE